MNLLGAPSRCTQTPNNFNLAHPKAFTWQPENLKTTKTWQSENLKTTKTWQLGT
jgi:hypothetical protein